MTQIKWLQPWRMVEGDEAMQLEKELERELPAEHLLHGKKVHALARRDDRDDVVFSIEADSAPFALVHLTFQIESDAQLPSTVLLSFDELEERVKMDNSEFISPYK